MLPTVYQTVYTTVHLQKVILGTRRVYRVQRVIKLFDFSVSTTNHSDQPATDTNQSIGGRTSWLSS